MDSIFAAIVGGVLVWAGQFFERYGKKKTEKETSLREIYAYCRKLEALMKNHYRELALAKTHTQYWYYSHAVSSQDPFHTRYYEEHLRSQSYAREIERRIGE